MATIEISITRALALQKTLTARIKKASEEIIIAVPTRGLGELRSVVESTQSVTDVEATLKAEYQSLEDLVKRRDDIRRKILISNATTKVTIAGKEYTVVEAIDARKGITEKEALLKRLKQNRMGVNQTFAKMTSIFDQSLESAKQSVINTGKNVTEVTLNTVTDPIKVTSTPGILDPLDLSKLIDELELEISDFKTNVDYVLSENNASTKIEIEE